MFNVVSDIEHPVAANFNSNWEDDGSGDVGGNYQEGEVNENTVADAGLSKV